MNRSTAIFAALLMSLVTSAQAVPVHGAGTWETTLKPRDINGDGVVDAFYDTDLNITWLRAGSTSVDYRSWQMAKDWAENGNFFDLTGWRLPTTTVTTSDGSCDYSYGGTSCGYNPDSSVLTGSELSHLFFQTLGNKAFYAPGTNFPQSGGLYNTGDFQNLYGTLYWSGTTYAIDSSKAWSFNVSEGEQTPISKGILTAYELAVRDGDVPNLAPVPEPATNLMVLAGLGLVGVFASQRRRTTRRKLFASAVLYSVSTMAGAMTATYTGSPFTHGQTQWGAIRFDVTFRDDFVPSWGQWSGPLDIQSVHADTTNGITFSPQYFGAQFHFDSTGQIDAWWLSVGARYGAGSYEAADFTSYRNGLDGPAAWDMAIMPGFGNAAWNDVSTGTWVQSELLAPVPEASVAVMTSVGLLVLAWATRRGCKLRD